MQHKSLLLFCDEKVIVAIEKIIVHSSHNFLRCPVATHIIPRYPDNCKWVFAGFGENTVTLQKKPLHKGGAADSYSLIVKFKITTAAPSKYRYRLYLPGVWGVLGMVRSA